MLSILLLLASIQNLHGLICYSNGTFNFSRNEFNWNNFSTILNNIENQIISNTSPCHVRITIDYNTNKNNYVIIKFSPSIEYNNTHIEFGSTLIFFKNQIRSIISYLDYTCLSGNLCDKNFLQKWGKQLLNSNNNSLHTNFISLYKNSNNSTLNICNLKTITDQCTSHLCFTIYDELKNLSYGKYQCEDKLSTNPVYIYIETYTENGYNYHQCMKNHCTDQVIYNLTLEKISRNKSIYDKYKLNEGIFIRTITIVSILLIIGFIAYYIQCRKYKQGYRLTTNA